MSSRDPVPDGPAVAVGPCPVCGHPVAGDAVICPNCGTSFKRRGGPDLALISASILAVAVGLLIAVLLSREDDQDAGTARRTVTAPATAPAPGAVPPGGVVPPAAVVPPVTVPPAAAAPPAATPPAASTPPATTPPAANVPPATNVPPSGTPQPGQTIPGLPGVTIPSN